jgi:hypothetical protein
MTVTLDELLSLVGRLDDSPGFDSPRERFRRFLLEQVTDVSTARALLDDCQRSVGEQRHRALQDLIVIVGRLLQFEIVFGRYDRAQIAQWKSPGQLEIVLELRTDQTGAASLESLERAVAAAREDRERRIVLCVMARHYAGRERLHQSAQAQPVNVRVVSVRSLLSLANHIAAKRLTHTDVVALLRSGLALDFVIELLDRPVSNDRPGPSLIDLERGRAPEPQQPAFWVATITSNEVAEAAQLLSSVIAHRRVLAICDAGRFRSQGSPGDWVCFFLHDRGIVGHAQLGSIVDDSEHVVRNADQFSRIYRLAHVTLYQEPIVRALRGERPFTVPPADVPLAGPCLTPIARQDFLALTRFDDRAAEAAQSATA